MAAMAAECKEDALSLPLPSSLPLPLLVSLPTTAAPAPLAPGHIRLHLPAIPHTITSGEFSHCAFTGKVLRFARMMHLILDDEGRRKYEVIHYGVEGSDAQADLDVQLLTRAEWEGLREASFAALYPDKPVTMLYDPTQTIGTLANITTPLYKAFNARLKVALAQHFRGRASDLVCLPFGPTHQEAVGGGRFPCIETGIGYPNPYVDVRVYESAAWMHYHLGKDGAPGKNYHFVVPNYFDAPGWPLAYPSTRPRVGFLGRICDIKGLPVVCAIAERCPDIEFVICGQGDPRAYLKHANIRYEPPLHGDVRAVYLGSLHALLAPSTFVEPFCGVSVEAQLCGTPVIAPAYGATTETVEHGRTGFLCHTLADYIRGVRKAVAGEFDRVYTRERAVAKYSLDAVAPMYDAVFCTALELSAGPGWYSPTSFMPEHTTV